MLNIMSVIGLERIYLRSFMIVPIGVEADPREAAVVEGMTEPKKSFCQFIRSRLGYLGTKGNLTKTSLLNRLLMDMFHLKHLLLFFCFHILILSLIKHQIQI